MTNWLDDLMPGMRPLRLTVDDLGGGVTLSVRMGGQGPAMLLLHGHPQTQAMWHRVVGPLMQRWTVVTMDLRGYGESDKPDDADLSTYSKRRMALDGVQVMAQLGFERFAVCAHDRGARVAHRLALDHPERVTRMMLLDIAPTLDMYEGTTEAFARAYWHWFFLVQPSPLPQALLGADPVAYLRGLMGSRHGGLGVFDPRALAHYEHCIALPGAVRGVCADYRASASIDLDLDRADRERGHRLDLPLRVLWARHGAVQRCFDPLALWRAASRDPAAVSGEALDCGHYLAEEQPGPLLAHIEHFFKE